MFKFNDDAAFSKNTGRGTVADVARSNAGIFLGASTVIFLERTDAETLEALACAEKHSH
jgi:hypothetical protein